MKGKAVSRALRGHFIIDQCLSVLIEEKVTDINDNKNLKSEIEALFTKLTSGDITADDVEFQKTFTEFKGKLVSGTKQLSTTSRTAALWISYMYTVSTVRDFIRADRLGLWELHLQALQNSLPVFVAAGLHNYVKSAYLYLQNMLQLKHTNLEVHNIFDKGNFVIRGSDRPWAGLPPDLIIEQVLMRSLKTTGGLTRGTGFDEIQRTVWLLSMPICCKYN
jgi:hypothetical protein